MNALLYLLPALLIALTLLARRYPGERLILAFTARPRRRRRGAAADMPHRPRVRVSRRVPRGGLLLGFALAVRPPPAAFTAS